MNPKRQSEIALKIVKYLLRKRGITLSQEDTCDEIKDIANAIEVPVEELKQFAKPLVQELLYLCLSAE